MNIEVIFYTQVVTIVAFVSAVFVLYRILVKQKDATIELLKERIAFLETQKVPTPDQLADALTRRVNMLSEELARLNENQEANESLIKEKEQEKSRLVSQVDKLKEQIEESEELLGHLTCPHCGAPVAERVVVPISGYVGGREIDADEMYEAYECGYAARDGVGVSPCLVINKK